MKINNRRYIGCKTKLLNFISNSIFELGFSKKYSFADIFAGTGVVAYEFIKQGYKTYVNDLLYSNFVIYQAFFGKGKIRSSVIKKEIDYLNNICPHKLQSNYFSKIYGKKYYSIDDSKKIGFIRDYIEDNKNKFTKREYYYLIASLLYAADKIANTVGHFESYLKRHPKTQGIYLDELDVLNSQNKVNIFNCDANLLVKKIKADIVYIDPPYNARQYVNFYHVLENLARWNKPENFEGKSMKFKRQELKSDYCRANAPMLFAKLIKDIDAKLIVVSYSNTYKAGSIASINTISQKQIIKILKEKGRLTIKEKTYKAFNSGKTTLTGHKEILYICEVK